jgi:mono/diheme cytochrome c family protein
MSDDTPPPDPKAFADPPQPEEIDLSRTHGSILREHNEPAEGRESVPLWLVGLIMALVFWGGLYLAYYSGGFRADAFLPRKDMTGGGDDLRDPSMLGKRVFMQSCVLCHQADGLGIPRVYPPLAGSEWVLGNEWRGDNHLVAIVLRGLQGPVEVRGTVFNNAMPGWARLRDDEVAAVLSYIRSEWGNTGAPISAEFVKTVREQTAQRETPWSPGELQAIARTVAPPPTPEPTVSPAAPSVAPEGVIQKARR